MPGCDFTGEDNWPRWFAPLNSPRERCPKCQRFLPEDGWCEQCTRDRQFYTLVALVVSGPLLGLSACALFGYNASLAAAFLCLAGPVMMIIYLIISSMRIYGKRRNNGNSGE